MKKIIRFIRAKKFEMDFNRYYEGLLSGDLYDAKVKALLSMKKNKEIWKDDYINGGKSVYKRLMEFTYIL